MIFCYEYEFPTYDYHDLRESMSEDHFEGNCQICNEIFTIYRLLIAFEQPQNEINLKNEEDL